MYNCYIFFFQHYILYNCHDSGSQQEWNGNKVCTQQSLTGVFPGIFLAILDFGDHQLPSGYDIASLPWKDPPIFNGKYPPFLIGKPSISAMASMAKC